MIGFIATDQTHRACGNSFEFNCSCSCSCDRPVAVKLCVVFELCCYVVLLSAVVIDLIEMQVSLHAACCP